MNLQLYTSFTVRMRFLVRTLITGANGFIGSRLLQTMQAYWPHECVGIDVHHHDWHRQLPIEQVDLRDQQRVTELLADYKPEVLVLSGAIKGLENCEKNPDAVLVNVFSMRPFLEYAIQQDAHVVFLSSDMVFGARRDAPFHERSYVAANNAYGAMKIAGEQLVSIVPRHTAVRTALVYGPMYPQEVAHYHQKMVDPVLSNQSWLPLWIALRALHGDVTELARNIYCTPTYIDDLTAALHAIVERGIVGTIHSCGHDRVSRYEVGEYVVQALQKSEMIRGFHADDTGLRPLDVALSDVESYPILQTPITRIQSGILTTLQQSGIL